MCLHTLPHACVDCNALRSLAAPLRFDGYSEWSPRALLACSTHAVHPWLFPCMPTHSPCASWLCSHAASCPSSIAWSGIMR